jgi:tetratricopeptide (TPR) repeat protein
MEVVHHMEVNGWHRMAIQLAIRQDSFHYVQDRTDESMRVWGEIVKSFGWADDSTDFAHSELRYAAALMGRGEAATALGFLNRCAKKFDHASDQDALAFTLYWQAACAWNLGQFDAALRYAEHGLALARQIDHRQAEFLNLRQVGQALGRLGRPAEGIEACKHAVSVAKELGQQSYDHAARQTLAHVYVMAGDYDNALIVCLNLLDLIRQLANVREEGVILGLLGDAYNGLGRHQEAAQVLAEALPIFRDNINRRYHGLCLLKLGYAYQGMGRFERAAGYLKDSVQIFRELHLTHYEKQAREAIAECLAAEPAGDRK